MSEQALLDLILKLKEQLRDAAFQHFFSFELFSWVWWLLIALIIVPLIVWWLLVDKKRLLEISMFGLLIGVSSTFLDVMGSDYVLWMYPIHIIPMTAILVPVDFVVLPVIQMYVYQKCLKWGRFLLFSLITAAMQTFIAEPLAILIGQYKPIHWSIIYSLPIYFAINVAAKFVVGRFKKRQEKEISKL